MSHYTVAVFANHPYDFGELLAPYDENNEAFFTFHPVDEADLRRDFEACQEDWDFETWLTHNQYCRDEDGQVGYMCNPDAKWDYYNLDARNHEFDLKPGEWDPDELHYRKNQYTYTNPDFDAAESTAFWQDYVINGKDVDPRPFWKQQYYLDKYGTLEEWLRHCASMMPFAFITPDGVWHSPGTVGWFATDDVTADSNKTYMDEWLRYINDASVNPYVSFVDCHI